MLNKPTTTATNKPRQPRGKAVEETELMKALEADPAAAMMALADEAESDWQELAKPAEKGMTQAVEEES